MSHKRFIAVICNDGKQFHDFTKGIKNDQHGYIRISSIEDTRYILGVCLDGMICLEYNLEEEIYLRVQSRMRMNKINFKEG